MKLVKLHLKDYNRLSVSGIRELIYKPEKKIQVILGTNGSGKSSLLKEILPNVDGLKEDYGENGLKKVTIEHRDNIINISYNRKTNKHSFVKNGEELNPSGLMKIQKQLIDDEFGITKEIMEILLSTNSFIQMSVGERKKWFTKILSHVDYDYALSVYNRAKDRVKELQSFIKLTRSKLIKEENVLKEASNGYEDSLKERLQILNSYLEKLLEAKEPYNQFDLDSLLSEINRLTLDTEVKLNKLLEAASTYGLELRNVDIKLTSLKTKKDMLEKNKEDLTSKMEKAESLKIDKGDNLEQIKSRIKDLEEKKKEIENLIPVRVDDYGYLLRIFNQIYMEIVETINLLEDYNSVDIKEEKELLEKSNKIKTELELLGKKINKLEAEINHLEELSNRGSTKCPKCGYEWIEGFSEAKLKLLKESLNKLNVKKQMLEEEYGKIEDLLTKIKEKKDLLIRLKSYLSQFDKPVYDYLLHDGLKGLREKLTSMTILVDKIPLLKQIEDELLDLTYKKSILEKMDNEKLNKILDRVEEIKNEYSKVIKELNTVTEEIDRLKKFSAALDTVNKQVETLKSLLREYRKNSKEIVKQYKNEFISKVIYELKKLISEAESELIEFKNAKKRFMALTDELKEYEERLKIMKEVTELLSPTKGIIGKSVVKIINTVLEEMNDIINRVWSYEIRILPCNIEENDLNFRFPVLINGNREIPDVSKGSSSIKEIIDLAFKIVAMKHLNMLDYPLILDEFGRTMDETHRIRAYEFIEDISEKYFSQIYLVAHFESLYSRFTDVDLVVLNDENLTIDTKDVNKVITLK